MPNEYKDEYGHFTSKENDGGKCHHNGYKQTSLKEGIDKMVAESKEEPLGTKKIETKVKEMIKSGKTDEEITNWLEENDTTGEYDYYDAIDYLDYMRDTMSDEPEEEKDFNKVNMNYTFPELTKEDLEVAKEIGLVNKGHFTKDTDFNSKGDVIMVGTQKQLDEFAERLGYELNKDYLMEDSEFDYEDLPIELNKESIEREEQDFNEPKVDTREEKDFNDTYEPVKGHEANEDINWEVAERNEKINGSKAKSTTRKDKYGNPLLSDEAFKVGVEAGKSFLENSLKYYDLETLKKSNGFLGDMASIIGNAIVNNGYDPNFDITYKDTEEIIGNVIGEEVDFEAYEGNSTKGFTGKKYTGYRPK